MVKNYYLSKTEQELISVIRSADMITIQEVEDLFPRLSKNMIKKILSSLVRKGRLYRLKRGIYLVNEEPGKPLIKNPYQIALMLFPGYIAFSTALRLYGLIEYEPFTVFVATPRKSGAKEIGEYTIKAVFMGEKATGVILKNGIYTSTLSKTFFDCYYKPGYCGGYSEITKALYEVGKLDWDELLEYFKRFASNSLCQRTGYILELVKDLGVDVPEDVIEYLRCRVRTWTKLVPTLPSKGKSVREWKLIDNLGKERILGWSYG